VSVVCKIAFGWDWRISSARFVQLRLHFRRRSRWLYIAIERKSLISRLGWNCGNIDNASGHLPHTYCSLRSCVPFVLCGTAVRTFVSRSSAVLRCAGLLVFHARGHSAFSLSGVVLLRAVGALVLTRRARGRIRCMAAWHVAAIAGRGARWRCGLYCAAHPGRTLGRAARISTPPRGRHRSPIFAVLSSRTAQHIALSCDIALLFLNVSPQAMTPLL